MNTTTLPQEWSSIRRLKDDNETVEKYVFTTSDAVAESVLYRYPTYAERTVICCSTQARCPVGCRFCGADDNFARNLTTEEIVSQPLYLLQKVEEETGTTPAAMDKLQIMFMSMGEPLLNQRRLVAACRKLHSHLPEAALLVSTSGPRVSYEDFFQAAEELPTIGLQLSVYESTEESRTKLVPFKNKLTLSELAQRGEEFFKRTGRTPFFNYCVYEENSSQEDVDLLAALFDPQVWQATVSVICERDETLKAAHDRQIELPDGFLEALLKKGYSVRRFNPAGQDTIGGGCG